MVLRVYAPIDIALVYSCEGDDALDIDAFLSEARKDVLIESLRNSGGSTTPEFIEETLEHFEAEALWIKICVFDDREKKSFAIEDAPPELLVRVKKRYCLVHVPFECLFNLAEKHSLRLALIKDAGEKRIEPLSLSIEHVSRSKSMGLQHKNNTEDAHPIFTGIHFSSVRAPLKRSIKRIINLLFKKRSEFHPLQESYVKVPFKRTYLSKFLYGSDQTKWRNIFSSCERSLLALMALEEIQISSKESEDEINLEYLTCKGSFEFYPLHDKLYHNDENSLPCWRMRNEDQDSGSAINSLRRVLYDEWALFKNIFKEQPTHLIR
eukprot:UC4_evm1s895